MDTSGALEEVQHGACLPGQPELVGHSSTGWVREGAPILCHFLLCELPVQIVMGCRDEVTIFPEKMFEYKLAVAD